MIVSGSLLNGFQTNRHPSMMDQGKITTSPVIGKNNIMKKEKSLLDLNLSELVDKSLAKGLIPFLQFIDKGKAITGETHPDDLKNPIDESPVDILKKQIRSYHTFISRIQSREGIDVNQEGIEEKLKKLETRLSQKIKEFQSAIEIIGEIKK